MARALRVWLPSIRAGSGSDVFVERLAEGLASFGHDPVVQWFAHKYELMPWCLRGVPSPPGVDVVHAGSWQAFAFKRQGLPLVVTEHHYVADPVFAPYRSLAQACYHRFFIAACLRRSFRVADELVAVSHHTARALAAQAGRDARVIHNWVDLEQFSPRKGAGRSAGPFRLLFVGNPSLRKGADMLATLATMLGEDFELLCLGGLREGYDVTRAPPNLKRLARVLSSEMPLLYHQVDAVLVPTRYEAFGYVALEAMASALPVVGFDSTGTSEVCRNGVTALLAPVNDLPALVAYCQQLASDAELARSLGAAGRERATTAFDAASGIAAYVDAYRMAMARYGR